MAGVFPVPVKTTGRKQWTLYNGGKGIKRLGSPLMDDWCPDSQVVLAKKLLDEKCDLDVDQEENARLGVYWLIKASEQGHQEATDLLTHCLETGQGICDQNYVDVRACLDMPQEEKLARCAARKVFESMSAGEDFITSDQLQKRMTCLDEQKEQKDCRPDEQQPSTSKSDDSTDWKSRSDGGEKLTEDVLISAASTYSRGELPLVTAVLSLQSTEPRPRVLRAVLLHPFNVVASSYNQIVRSLGRHSIWWYMPLSLAQVKLVLSVVFLLSVGLDSLIALLPSVLYFCSLAVMVVATCQILTKKQDLHHFRRWSNLFLAYSEGNVNAGRAEFQYCRNNLRPYAWFFLGLLAHLLLYPSLRPIIPQSELAVLAFGLTCLTLYNFTILTGRRRPDWLALFSFAVHVLAKYPYETDAVVSQGWRFLDVHVPTFASYVVGNGVEFCLNFRALFYLVIPAVLVKMAARDSWRGCYTALVPHCVALSWWQIAVTASEGATGYGLIRSALALVGLVLFLPLAGLATILLPVAAAGKFLAESGELVRLATTSLLALLPVLLSLYLGKLKALHTRLAVILGWIQVLLSITAALLLIWPALHFEENSEVGFPSSLSWEQFQTFCPAVAFETETAINTHFRCSQLVGQPVSWEGRVSAARVVKVSNPLAHLINRLPLSVRGALTCLLGEPYHRCDSGPYCSLPSGLINKCHLTNWNRYEVEVDVSMNTGRLWQTGDSVTTLMGDHTFLNFTHGLGPGDRVWFAGLLRGDPAGLLTRSHPRVTLLEVGCLSCQNTDLEVTKKAQLLTAFTLRDLYSGIKTVLNFLFNPLVIFR